MRSPRAFAAYARDHRDPHSSHELCQSGRSGRRTGDRASEWARDSYSAVTTSTMIAVSITRVITAKFGKPRSQKHAISQLGERLDPRRERDLARFDFGGEHVDGRGALVTRWRTTPKRGSKASPIKKPDKGKHATVCSV